TMVYDIFGQNVADYSGSTVTSLARENIYRGEQLLATQTFTATVMNVALSANGGVATSSSNFNVSPYHFTAAGANDGDRKGANWGSGSGWNSADNTIAYALSIDVNAKRSTAEIEVLTVHEYVIITVAPTAT